MRHPPRRKAGRVVVTAALASMVPTPDAGQLMTSYFEAADLRRSGLVRVADILRLADGWDVVSIDGFTLDARPPGFVDGIAAPYAVEIDGVPVDVSTFGETSLNRLGLSLDDIESVEVSSRPGMVNGRISPGGTIFIDTRRPPGGAVRGRPRDPAVTFRARHASGSEAGDPGPFQFTERATPNVERLGFESSASLGAGAGLGFWSDAAYTRARHYASDEAIWGRWNAIGGEDFRVLEKHAPSVRAGWIGREAAAFGFARESTIDEGFFLRPLGREIPVESTLREWGASGWIARGEIGKASGSRTGILGNFLATTNDLDASERSGSPRLDWRHTSRRGAVTFVRRFHGSRDIQFGGRLDAHEVAARGRFLEARNWNDAALFAEISGHERDLAGAIGRSRGRLTYAIQAIAGNRSLDASIVAARRPPEEAAPFAFWRARGFDVLDDPEAGALDGTPAGPVSTRGDLAPTSMLSGDLGVSIQASRVRGRAGVFARRFADLALDDIAFEADSLGFPRAASTVLHFEEEGTTAGVSLTGMARLTRGLRLRVAWRGQDAVGGTTLFRDAARAVPKHLGRIALLAGPRRNFELEFALRLRSGARWEAYNESLPATAAVDLSLSKSLAGRHLALGLALRDLFDRPIRNHPLGETERLTLVVQAGVGLGGVLP